MTRTPQDTVRHLISDDIARAVEHPGECKVELDGVAAINGWRQAAAAAGDSALVETLDTMGLDALAAAWDELVTQLITELAPELTPEDGE